MPPHKFTPEETAKGTRKSIRERAKLARFEKERWKHETEMRKYDLIKTALTSPVLAGTIAYIGVNALQSGGNALSSNKETDDKIHGFIADLFTGALGNGELLGSAGNFLKNLSYDSLRIVILIYIASGGNLAGLLSSTPGFLSGMAGMLGLAEAGAGV